MYFVEFVDIYFHTCRCYKVAKKNLYQFLNISCNPTKQFVLNRLLIDKKYWSNRFYFINLLTSFFALADAAKLPKKFRLSKDFFGRLFSLSWLTRHSKPIKIFWKSEFSYQLCSICKCKNRCQQVLLNSIY